jgi:hypothetical protein
MLNEDNKNLESMSFRPGDFFPEVAEAVAGFARRHKKD